MASRKCKKTQPPANARSTEVQEESIPPTIGNVTAWLWKHCWHWVLIIHAGDGLKLGACSTCHAHKIHCEVSPGATVCKRCEQSGQAATCVHGTSRTHSTRSSSTPPADTQSVHPAPGRKQSDSTHSCPSGDHQPKKRRSLKSQGGTETVLAHGSSLQGLDSIREDEGEFIVSLRCESKCGFGSEQ